MWRLRTRTLTTDDHTLVMGVVNVTPDSFSDGGPLIVGEVVDVDRAVEHARALVAAGADIVDIGGESTRPGSLPVSVEVEVNRVLPVIEALVEDGAAVSVDTSKSEVAAAALDVGVEIVNDVRGLRDPALRSLCAERACGVVVMHMGGEPQTMQDAPVYDDVVADVAEWLEGAAAEAEAAGIPREAICIDPGIGFGKTWNHNLEVLGSLDAFVTSGRPVLVGASRKGFLGAILEDAGHPAPASLRDPATMATVAASVLGGVAVVRVHDVAGAVQAARTADAIVRGSVGST